MPLPKVLKYFIWLLHYYHALLMFFVSLKLDSNQMYELFVPVSFFDDPTVERFLTARKISEVRKSCLIVHTF